MSALVERFKALRTKKLILDTTTVTATGADLNLLAGQAAQGVTRLKKVAVVTLGVGAGAGACFAWANPETTAIFVNRVTLDITTASTGAGTVSVGQAANGTTLSANLIDGLSTTPAVVADNISTPGTLGKPLQKVAAGAFVTGSKASGALTGMVGKAYIEYFSL